MNLKRVIAHILESITIIDEFTIDVFSKKIKCAIVTEDLNGESDNESDKARQSYIKTLANLIYSQFYNRSPSRWIHYEEHKKIQDIPPHEVELFVSKLNKIHPNIKSIDPLWTVVAIAGPTHLILQKNGHQITANIDKIIPISDSSIHARIGDKVNIITNKSPYQSGSFFYYVYSHKVRLPTFRDVKLYFNTKPEHIFELIELLCHELNYYKIPFLFKCPSHSILFDRLDNSVLYLSRKDFAIASRILSKSLSTINSCLNPEVPLFTKQLSSGLAFAEGSLKGQSFGIERCSLIATAIYNSKDLDFKTEEEKVNYIISIIQEENYDAQRMYLNPGSQYPFDFSSFNRKMYHPKKRNHIYDNDLLVAQSIANNLIRRAHWSKGYCTWMEYQSKSHSAINGSDYHSIGFDLYGGIAGIALFLCYIGDAVEDQIYLETAEAALNNVKYQLENGSYPTYSNEFFNGLGGIGYVFKEAGEILKNREWRKFGIQLLGKTSSADIELEASNYIDKIAIQIVKLYRKDINIKSTLHSEDLVNILSSLGSKLEGGIKNQNETFSLASGMTCWAEALATASSLDGLDKYRKTAESYSKFGYEYYFKTGLLWPFGPSSNGSKFVQETPGLFTGISGVGYYYLRRYLPDRIPEILLPIVD